MPPLLPPPTLTLALGTEAHMSTCDDVNPSCQAPGMFCIATCKGDAKHQAG